nr:GNAT family N-acetyltransferase [Roseibium denhamense]
MQVLPLVTKARPDLLTSGTYYVAETPAGQIAGAGGWTKHSPTGRDETANNGNIRHFATHPEHARQGIGSALISRCLQTAAASGLTELNCYSTLNGEAFYAACGFKRMEPVTIPLPGDVPFPAIRMVKGL